MRLTMRISDRSLLFFLIRISPLILAMAHDGCKAWEDSVALHFVQQHHPVLNAQHMMTDSLQEPEIWQAMLNHTHVVARLNMGGIPFAPGTENATATLPIHGASASGGLSLSLPLGESGIRHDMHQQRLREAETEMRILEQVLTDLLELHQREEAIRMTQERIAELENDIRIMAIRIQAGLSPLDALNTGKNNLYQQRLLLDQQHVLLAAWQHKVSRYAGEQWQMLLGYLQGMQQHLP